MGYSKAEYGFLYQQYKNAESEITAWITSQSPPNPNGGCHSFSRLGELARELYRTKKLEMPEELRNKLKLSIEVRIKLVTHHEEKGDANSEHDFPIVMFAKIAQALFPAKEVLAITKLVQAAGIEAVPSVQGRRSISTEPRSKSTPAGPPQWQRATSWRSKSLPNLRKESGDSSTRRPLEADDISYRGRTTIRRF